VSCSALRSLLHQGDLVQQAAYVSGESMSQNILIVEDEASIREPLAKYFENNQFRVRAAPNAAEARTLLSAHAFDLVISDIMMPGEDGLSLCRHIRATSNLPVILLTAKTEELDRTGEQPAAEAIAAGHGALCVRRLGAEDG
jgi:CheY-like chemotaxis protein